MTYKDENDIEPIMTENINLEQDGTPRQATQLSARRQHIAAIIFMFVKTIKELIFAFGIGLFLTIKENWKFALIFGGGFFLLVLIFSLFNWLRFTYRVEENELRVESGVFIRQKKYVPLNRIHTIDYSANPIHRLFKLVKVKVDTGSGGFSELNLSAITRKEGDKLRSALGKSNLSPSASEEDDMTTFTRPARLDKISLKRLIIAASTSGGFGALIFAAYLGGSQILNFIPDSYFESTLDWFTSAGGILLLTFSILAIICLYIIGITGTVLKYAFFTIEQFDDHLFIKRGLLETKELTIAYDRIQSITIKQNILRRLFGFVSIHATVVGNVMDGAESVNPVLFPILKKKEVDEFIQNYLPQYVVTNSEWTGLPRKSLLYYIGRAVIIPLIVTGVVGYLLPKFIIIPIITILLFALLGFLSFKTAGLRKDTTKLQLRKGFFQKQTKIVLRNRIQTLEKSQHKLQQMQQLSTIHLAIFGGTLGEFFSVTHFADKDVNEVAEWFSRRDNNNIAREIKKDS